MGECVPFKAEPGASIKHFSDFAKEQSPLEGSKLKLEDIVNKEILVLGYRVKPSKYGKAPCVTIQFVLNEEKHILFTGSTILKEQLEKYNDQLPFYATIKKVDRYYTFS